MKMESFSEHTGIHKPTSIEQGDISDRIERLLESLPNEIRWRWEKEIENKSDIEAVEVLEKVIRSRRKILEGAQNITPEGFQLESEIEKAVEEIVQADREGVSEVLDSGDHGKVVRYSEKICIKLMTDDIDEKKLRENVEREAFLLNRMYGFVVDGVRVPKVYTMSLKTPPFFIGMETIDGKSLHTIMHNKKESAEYIELIRKQNKEEVILRIQGFLRQMHIEKRIIHRDIHEVNIMIDKNGDWYVVDFGKAVEISLGSDSEADKKEDLDCARESILCLYKAIEEQT